jgi:hypothetical protein
MEAAGFCTFELPLKKWQLEAEYRQTLRLRLWLTDPRELRP